MPSFLNSTYRSISKELIADDLFTGSRGCNPLAEIVKKEGFKNVSWYGFLV